MYLTKSFLLVVAIVSHPGIFLFFIIIVIIVCDQVATAADDPPADAAAPATDTPAEATETVAASTETAVASTETATSAPEAPAAAPEAPPAPIAVPSRPIEININANVNELAVDYDEVLTQMQRFQQMVAEKVENLARQFDSAREVVLRKIKEEDTRITRELSQSRRLTADEKIQFIGRLQPAVTSALREVERLGLTTPNDLRSSNMKSNMDDTTKLMTLVTELQEAQGKALEAMIKSVTSVPAQMNGQWATVEKIIEEIDFKIR